MCFLLLSLETCSMSFCSRPQFAVSITRVVVLTDYYTLTEQSIMTTCVNRPPQTQESRLFDILTTFSLFPSAHSRLRTTHKSCRFGHALIHFVNPHNSFKSVHLPVFSCHKFKNKIFTCCLIYLYNIH